MRWFWLSLVLALPAAAQTSKGIDCYCTDGDGGRVEMGQIVCLSVGGRSFSARCEMSLNVPMWREIGAGCLAS